MRSLIQIDGLSFAYVKGNDVLRDVTLQVEEGQIAVLLGRNGCGKSTLLDCLIGYHRDFVGNVEVCGKSIRDLSPRQLAKHLSYVPQQTECKIDYTVNEFLLIGRTPYLPIGGYPSEIDFEIVQSCAERCGITNLLDKSILRLSGGERQLVFLAKALAQDTPIIILDEPFSALDIVNQQEMLALMKSLAICSGKTILLTTHDPNHALYLDAKVFLMSNGSIVDSGSANEMIKPEKLKPVYGEKIGYCRDLPYDEISFSDSFQGSKFAMQ